MSRFGKHDPADGPDKEQVESVWAYDGELDLDLSDMEGGNGSSELEYISKSRLKTFLKCPRKFAFKYFAGEREDENFYMKRGSDVHDTFEAFHQEAILWSEGVREEPRSFTHLLPESEKWFQFTEWIGEFFRWELSRLNAARSATDTEQEAIELWAPHSVEEELWIDDPPVGELPWMGPYDALLHAASVPLVDSDEGYVVVDYKTGSTPEPKYRDTGIHIDLEFYSWMLKQEGFDVVAGIGMYPTGDEHVVRQMPNADTRSTIAETIRKFHELKITMNNYDTHATPLCDYCHYFDQCPTEWKTR